MKRRLPVREGGFFFLCYDKQGNVLLHWTSSSTGKAATMALHPHEFIRRWLLHVLAQPISSHQSWHQKLLQDQILPWTTIR